MLNLIHAKCKKCVNSLRGEYGDTPLIEIKSISEKNN